jgi:hypothetical protein
MTIPEMNETQLREEENRLDAVVRSGKATVSQANRLAEIRRDLKRIHEVKCGKAW